MSEQLFSPHWYRVSDLKPQLRDHVHIHRHDYRGLIWYVLEDKASGRSHRFNATAYAIIGLLDGNLSINQIWNSVHDRLGDIAPTQEQMIQLLGKLHAADLLQSDLPIDNDMLFKRGKQYKQNKIKQRFANPLAIRISLWDPDDFLQQHLPKLQWLFHWVIAAIWALTVIFALLLAASHWQQLTVNAEQHLLSPYNLTIMVLLYPLLKFLHEMGHAICAKKLGAEVHEMGVSFLLFMPIPYVDVSTVSLFKDKWQRMMVGAAGIVVELFFAAVALLLWLNTEEGLFKDIVYNTLVLGGVSSVFFNGNPLLKYDGYFVLADYIEIPNLYERSKNYLVYLAKKHLLAESYSSSPAMASGEAGWFLIFGISAFIYRTSLLWIIIVYVTDRFFIVGVLLAIGMVGQQLLWPLLKGLLFVWQRIRSEQNCLSATTRVSATALFLLLLIFVLPIPSYTHSEGIVWMPEDVQLRSETDGFAGELLVELSSDVKKDTAIITIEDPLLDTEAEVLRSKLTELNTQFRAEWETDYVKAENIKQEMYALAEEIKQVQKKQQGTRILSKKNGKLIIPEADDLPGRFLHQGDLIGYVIDDTKPIVRIAVNQADIGRIQKYIKKIEIRLVNQSDQIIPATIKRRIPQATNQLPSPALASVNGGKIAIDPAVKDSLQAKEKLFLLDLEFVPSSRQLAIGQRVYVRFHHGTETLALQWYRSFRQVFLRQFNV